MKSIKKYILKGCFILVFALIIIGLYKVNSSFNQSLAVNFQGIYKASYEANNEITDINNISNEDYYKITQKLYNDCYYNVKAIKESCEDSLIYRKYDLSNLMTFLMEISIKDENISSAVKEKNLDSIKKIKIGFECLDELSNSYNFIFDKDDISKAVNQLENNLEK